MKTATVATQNKPADALSAPAAAGNPIGVGTIIHDARQADEETLQHLAQLSVIDYDRIREDEAKQLKMRTGTLDRLVMDLVTGSECGSCGG